jgi:hypothetical protein
MQVSITFVVYYRPVAVSWLAKSEFKSIPISFYQVAMFLLHPRSARASFRCCWERIVFILKLVMAFRSEYE